VSTPRSRVSSDASAVLGLKVVHALLLFVTSAVVSRGLGPEGRGVYYTPLLAATTAIALCHLGLDQANVYLFGSRRIPLPKLLGQAGVVSVLGGTIGGLIILALARAQVSLFAGIPEWMIVASAVLVPFGVHAILSTGLLTLQGRVLTPLVIAIGIALSQLAVLGGLAGAGKFTPAWVFLAASGAICITPLLLARSLAGTGAYFAWDPVLLKETLAHSLVLHLGMALLFLHLRVDMFLVKWMLGTAALGLYSLAVVLAESLMLVSDSLGTTLTSRQMTGSVQDAAEVALRGARAVAVLGGAMVLGWFIFGRFLIRLVFGSPFDPIYAPLLILLPGIVLLGMQRVCGPAVLRAGRPWLLTAVEAAGFTTNLLLNLWWIPIWSLGGAAAASSVSYALMALTIIFWTVRLGGQSLMAMLPRGEDVARVTAEANRLFVSVRAAMAVERRDV
jgi:O-antigen/teichoic acid export membrane protein